VSFRFGPHGAATHHYAAVCLNSLLFKYEGDLAAISTMLGNAGDSADWKARAMKRGGQSCDRPPQHPAHDDDQSSALGVTGSTIPSAVRAGNLRWIWRRLSSRDRSAPALLPSGWRRFCNFGALDERVAKVYRNCSAWFGSLCS
jgi:hypothetical protein